MVKRPKRCAGCCWFPCDRNYDYATSKCIWWREHKPIQGKKTYDLDFGPKAPTAIDLFCGCGGASLGFIAAGMNVLCGIDLDDYALKTYQMNIGGAVKADVRFLPLRESIQPTLVHYSPPCQGYSTANTKKKTENGDLKPKYRKINRLMLYGALAVEHLQPEFITMENVPGAAKSAIFKEMTFFLRFESSTVYDLQWKLLDVADYGVPQHRVRLWMVGAKMKIEGMISFPASMSIAEFNALTLPMQPVPADPDQAQLFEFAPEVA